MTPVAWVVLGYVACLLHLLAIALCVAAKRGDERRGELRDPGEWADYLATLEEHYRRERAINRLIADSQRPN